MKTYKRCEEKKNYYEKTIHFNFNKEDIFELATYLGLKSDVDKNFILYEKDYNISLGIGIAINISVYKEKIVYSYGEKCIEILIKDINEDLKSVFKKIPIIKWKAYGTVSFNYSNYMYHIECVSNKEKLMEFIIPKVDIYISENSINIKALEKRDIKSIEEKLQKYKKTAVGKDISKDEISNILNKRADEYMTLVAQAINEINCERYQKVILSRKINLDKRIDMERSYLLGRKNNNPARSYYINLENYEVIGFSPETVVEIDSNKNVYTFPLAGTRAMGENYEEKSKLRNELLSDPKEIAEHAISVKLAYEELKKCCVPNSVCVIRFMEVLDRGTVQHLASRLKGKIKKNMNEWHALSYLFPAVTASGIPKKESIEAINRLEEEERKLYSGGVFIYDESGTLDVALVLRSAYQNSKESWVQVGAGIVKLSNPNRELEETKEKLRSVMNQIVYK